MAEKTMIRLQPVDLDDFFKLDYRSGSINNLLTDERMHLVPVSVWSKLNESLLQELEEDGSPAIHLVGYSLGTAFVEELKGNIENPEVLAKHFTDLSAAAGWGVISMAGDLEEGKSYVVTVMNCAFCEKGTLSQSPQCAFLASVIEGMADKVYGGTHRASEIRCTATGEALCQFGVEEVPLGPNSSASPRSSADSDWESLWSSAIPELLLSGQKSATKE